LTAKGIIMNGYEAYSTYLALKQHFTSEYDFYKYSGKVSASNAAFEKRRDKLFFDKLAKHEDIMGFLVANLVSNPRVYIKNLSYNKLAEKVWKDHVHRQANLLDNLKRELQFIEPPLRENLLVKSGQHPPLLKLYLSKKVSLDTLCMICYATKCVGHWDKELGDDVVYADVGKLMKNYTPFISYDRTKVKQILKEYYA
jgi:hypothetical protein